MYAATKIPHSQRNNIKEEETEKISSAVEEIQVTIAYENGEQQVILNNENVGTLVTD